MKNINSNQVAYKITYLKPSEKTCPKCGSSNIQSISRITGYLSLDERFGSGKAHERADRVCHNKECHSKSYNL